MAGKTLNLNIEKEKILLCSFVTQTQIQTLMEGTRQQAKAVFEHVKEQTKKDGKLLPHDNKVSKSRVIKVLGINENDIHKNADIERKIKKDASV